MKLGSILIIHPSRGRPAMACSASRKLLDNRRSGIGFRYVLSLDLDDSHVDGYCASVRRHQLPAELLVAGNSCVVEAVNRAAAMLGREDLIFNMNDDFDSSPGWDVRLMDAIATIGSGQYLIQPVDMDNGSSIPVIQIVSAELYRRLGYLLYHGYQSMYADQDLLEACRYIGAAHPVSGLGFSHLHPNYGKGQWDETYARENSLECYQAGERLIGQRRARNFDLTP